MANKQLKYKIALRLLPKIGSINAKNLIAYAGSPEAVFKIPQELLLKIPGIGNVLSNLILKNRKTALERAEKEIQFISKNGIKVLFFLDKNYPFLLKQCPDAPILLFQKGEINFENRKAVSIVGTRNATPEGLDNVRTLVKDLVPHNPIIVSGLAYGIDVCAHKEALKQGLDTVAVLGHGFDRLYPAAHKKVAKSITENGALLTEFLSASKFDRQNFLQRNRIVAGLSQASIIAESAIKGGSLTTANIANSYSRDVFAFPGRLTDKYSEGCNALIKQNRAALIQSAKDIEYLLGWEESKEQAVQQHLFAVLSEDEKVLAKILNEQKSATIDIICKESKFSMSRVSALLLGLEFKNLIRSLPGKVYQVLGEISI